MLLLFLECLTTLFFNSVAYRVSNERITEVEKWEELEENGLFSSFDTQGIRNKQSFPLHYYLRLPSYLFLIIHFLLHLISLNLFFLSFLFFPLIFRYLLPSLFILLRYVLLRPSPLPTLSPMSLLLSYSSFPSTPFLSFRCPVPHNFALRV